MYNPPGHRESVRDMVDSAWRHWEARQASAARTGVQPRTANAMTVAISRQKGTLATAVAQLVGKKLGWQVYDHNLLELIAQEMGVRTALLESIDERQQGWLRQSIEGFITGFGKDVWLGEGKYVHRLVETVLALGIHGECLIVGRGATCILPPQTTLRVRLMAPLKDRIAALSHKQGISLREAGRQIRDVDRDHNGFVENHFHKCPTDVSQYDLILNAARLPIAAEADLIVEALRWRQRAASDATQRGSLLESHVEATSSGT